MEEGESRFSMEYSSFSLVATCPSSTFWYYKCMTPPSIPLHFRGSFSDFLQLYLHPKSKKSMRPTGCAQLEPMHVPCSKLCSWYPWALDLLLQLSPPPGPMWTLLWVAVPSVLRGGFLEDGVEELTWTALGHVGWSVHWVRVRFLVMQDKVRVEEKGPGWAGASIAFLPWPHEF